MQQTAIHKFTRFILAVFLFLIPLFFHPFTTDFYEYNKFFFLIGFSGIFFLLWMIQITRTRRFVLHTTPFELPLFILFVLSLLSTIFQSSYKFGSLLSSVGPVSLGCLLILYIAVVNTFDDKNDRAYVILPMIFSGLVLSVITILWTSGMVSPLFSVEWLKNKSFSPAGTPLFTLLFLLLPLSFMLYGLIVYMISLENQVVKKIESWAFLYFGASILLLSSCAIIIINFLKNGLTVLPYSAGWAIAFDAFKSIPTFLLGIGPGNFLTAFSLARPAWLNSTPLWNTLFSSSSSFVLTLSTEIGSIAVILFFYICLRVFLKVKKRESLHENFLYIPLSVALLLQLVSLTGITLLVYTIILLAVTSSRKKIVDIHLTSLSYGVWVIVGIPLIIFGTLFFFTGKIYSAELLFKKSLDNIPGPRGQDVYNMQIRALRLNPFSDKYHASFSQTNLALANSLAGKKDLTEVDKQTIPQLVQQALAEARNAVSLNQTSVVNWSNLGSIYNSLIRFANGADGWAVSSYQQEINLFPTDPQARLHLGGVYYALGRYPEAITAFSQAVALKSDWTNARYNLAYAYKNNKDYQKAYETFQQTISLLPPDSPEIAKVQKDIDLLKPLLPSPTPTSATESANTGNNTLSLPSPIPTGAISPVISIAPPQKPTPTSTNTP